MREGDRRSAEVARGAPLLPDAWGQGTHRTALRAWAGGRLSVVWVRHRKLIIGLGLFLLLDLVIALGIAASGGHF